MEDPTSDLGTVTCSLEGPVVAGSYQSCALTYTAGFAGIDDTGSLKIVMRYATDSGEPQFDDPQGPNYVTAAASNGARLALRYDIKDNVRPWDKTIYVKVLQGFLREGDRITVTLGDRSGGSVGWRIQTFLEETFELRVLIDRYATYVYEQVPGSPTFRVAAGEPIRLVAVAPSLVKPKQPVPVRWKLEDRWGNPVGQPRQFVHPGFDKPGCYTVPVTDDQTGLEAESNPVAVRQTERYGRYWGDLHGQSEETIGTNSIEDHFRFARDYAFLDVCAHQGNDFQITDEFWRTIQETTRSFNEPGRFVTFPGWEWSGNTALGGDRNVLFRDEGGPIHRSSRALLSARQAAQPCCPTVEDLFETLGSFGPDVMLVPHVGGRFADLARHAQELEPVVEVHSAWGTFQWFLDEALEHGYRVGVVANSDGHKGRPGASYPGASTFGSYGGLTCILAERLDRESVWQAYQNRRVYATTGARILLDVTADGDVPIGAVVPIDSERIPALHIRAVGTASLERLEICNGCDVLETRRPDQAGDLSNRVKVLWQGAAVRGRGRQVNWDGELEVSGNRIESFELINFHNPEKPCVRRGVNRLSWQSQTTGGVAGVILTLETPTGGDLKVHTSQSEFHVPIAELSLEGRRWELGGLGKQISACRLPPAGGRREMNLRFQPALEHLHPGDNPLYVRLIQEDGHMAWTSPIYLIVPQTP